MIDTRLIHIAFSRQDIVEPKPNDAAGCNHMMDSESDSRYRFAFGGPKHPVAQISVRFIGIQQGKFLARNLQLESRGNFLGEIELASEGQINIRGKSKLRSALCACKAS